MNLRHQGVFKQKRRSAGIVADSRGRIIGWCAILLFAILSVQSANLALNMATAQLIVNKTLIVNDTGDEGDADANDGVCATDTDTCTLRAAIQQANAQADAASLLVALINFDIPGDGPYTIQPMSPLPPITVSVRIDGTTQPGFDMAMGSPIIDLDGSRSGDDSSGLTIIAGDSSIQGLLIRNFAVNGVRIDNSHNNAVGAPGARNVISSNMFDGILISGTSTMNQIDSNVIDTNMMNGIAVPDAGLANTILNNSISNNMLNGILISGTSTMNEIRENAISDNMLNGILISGTSTMNEIRENSISSNDGLGIDLGDDGANNLQNAPELSSIVLDAEDATITGNLASIPETMFTLEFFANTNCDASGFGEGERFIGLMTIETDAMGDATFEFSAVLQEQEVFITATATDPSGNTSEFSACRATE